MKVGDYVELKESLLDSYPDFAGQVKIAEINENTCMLRVEDPIAYWRSLWVNASDVKMKEANASPTGSLRFNTGKPEVSQLSSEFILALADLITVSAKKYGKYNWALGQEFSTPYDSCMRHLLAFGSGEDNDKESGKSHLLHAAANMMILWHSQQKNSAILDDRMYKFLEGKNV